MTRTRFDPPGRHSRGAETEGNLGAVLTQHTTPPTRRRCPSCRIQRPSGEFAPVVAAPGARGIAFRRCPACGVVALLVSFARIDQGGREVRR
jgi:hypothetical protein